VPSCAHDVPGQGIEQAVQPPLLIGGRDDIGIRTCIGGLGGAGLGGDCPVTGVHGTFLNGGSLERGRECAGMRRVL
jgi:hypothetical protein